MMLKSTGSTWLSTTNVFFFVNYTAQYTTNVRFRLVVTGPEFYMRTSETWYGAKYKTNSLYYVYGPKSDFFKTKVLIHSHLHSRATKALGWHRPRRLL